MGRYATVTNRTSLRGSIVVMLLLVWPGLVYADTGLISGTIDYPRSSGSAAWQQPSRASIHVSLQRINANGRPGGAIVNEPTWVIIHGRSCAASDFYSLAGVIAMQQPGSQVLVLDWQEGAADNFPTGLTGAAWTAPVARWAIETLKSLGLTGRQVSLVGHSWGAYIAYDIAAAWTDGTRHGVRSIVALDPASSGVSLTPSLLRLSSVADWSWAFFDNDVCGSAHVTLTANESFSIDCGNSASERAKHWTCVPAFEQLLRRGDQVSKLFSLARLQSATAGPWGTTLNTAHRTASSPKFAAVLHLGRSIDGTGDLLHMLIYLTNGKEIQLTFDTQQAS